MTAMRSMVAGERLRPKKRLTGEEAAFLKQHAPGPWKITMPGPLSVAGQLFKPGITDQVYGDRQALAEDIAAIFRLGTLASVDRGSRIPPLDVPVKAELFGISAWRQAGAGKRHVAYRFTVLDDRELRKLEAVRQSAGELLRYFTFPLSNGVRWMPRAAAHAR